MRPARFFALAPLAHAMGRLQPGKTLDDFPTELSTGDDEEPTSSVDVGGVPLLSPGDPLAFVGAMQSIPTGTSVFLTLDFEAGGNYVVFEEEAGFRAELSVK
jgi:hypothetical protein